MATIKIPGYKIIKKLGVGGQATVYLAIQVGFDREVALKIMSPALAADPTFGDRFIREAKIVAKLSHNNIVTVYDAGKSENYFYLAMEYLPGSELKNRIETGMKARECLTVIGKIAQALHFAHDKGYIHRDVKSENILFNENEEPVLTDFGIAKASNSATQMTQTGKLIGTPEYMSPEQCRGQKIDGRADLYSLGIILYEMLTGSVPFTAEDSVAICIMHVTSPVPQLPPRLQRFQWIIDLLLAKMPESRIQSGNELRNALLEFIKTGQSNIAIKEINKNTKVSKPRKSQTEVNAIYKEPDNFDDLHTEKRNHYQAEKPQKKGSFGKKLILIIILATTGFYTQQYWYSQTEVWVNENVVKQARKLIAEVTAEPQKKITVDQLLSETNKLVKTKQQNLLSMKKALNLIATVNTIEANNPEAKAIYQNIINNSIAEALALAEKKLFDDANKWLALVELEKPKHPLLTVTKQNIQKLKTAFELTVKEETIKQEYITEKLSLADQAFNNGLFLSNEEDNAVYYYRQALEKDENNAVAQAQILKIADLYVDQIETAISKKQVVEARHNLILYKTIPGDQLKISELEEKLLPLEKEYKQQQEKNKRSKAAKEKVRQIEVARKNRLSDPLVQMQLQGILSSAKDLEQSLILVEPAVMNAFEKYQAVLEIDDRNQQAKNGIKRIEQTLLTNLTHSIDLGDKTAAYNWLKKLKIFNPKHKQEKTLQQKIENIVEPLPLIDETTTTPSETSLEVKKLD